MTVDEVRHHAHAGPLALVVRAGPCPDGCLFLTDPAEPLQVALMSRPAGHKVGAHTHPPVRRETMHTQEVLLVRSGRVRLSLYSSQGEPAGERVLGPGDLAVLLRGGHALEALEASEVAEVKSGPYCGRRRDKAPLEVR